MRNILLDTGPVVALLRPSDQHHRRAASFFSELSIQDHLLTTWPVITECAFVMRHHEATFWDWLLDSGIELAEFGLTDIPVMRSWRARYADREVDFADATLVWLAAERRTNLIATTDLRDFQAYRLYNGKPFKLVLPR